MQQTRGYQRRKKDVLRGHVSHLPQVVSNEVLLVAALTPQDHDAVHKSNTVNLRVGNMRTKRVSHDNELKAMRARFVQQFLRAV